MGASTDLSDARQRAARVLSAFEAAVKGEGGAAQAALEAALRDTALLKRAVAIQNARQHEAASVAAAEVAALKAQLQEAQLSAYSLSMHLREALAHSHKRGGPDWVT